MQRARLALLVLAMGCREDFVVPADDAFAASVGGPEVPLDLGESEAGIDATEAADAAADPGAAETADDTVPDGPPDAYSDGDLLPEVPDDAYSPVDMVPEVSPDAYSPVDIVPEASPDADSAGDLVPDMPSDTNSPVDIAEDTLADAGPDAADTAPDVSLPPTCTPGTCDDGNVCTTDECQPTSGCTHGANAAACDDLSACTGNDVCAGGSCIAGAPALFAKPFGGKGGEWALGLAVVKDGVALAGFTESKGKGGNDAWLVRIDAAGKAVWDKTFGDPGSDEARAVVALTDGFLLAGTTNSKGGGKFDGWLVRTDAAGGLVWDKAYGGADIDGANALAVTADGFVFAGVTHSKGAGGSDFWLVRTDAKGVTVWDNALGTAGNDVARAVVVVPDGFVVAGHTFATATSYDAWLVRTDAAGKELWHKGFGGKGDDRAFALAAVADGFVLAGNTESKGVGGDAWLVRTDAAGGVVWERTFGGGGHDLATGIAVAGGGLAVAGSTTSEGAGAYDFWAMHLDGLGNLQWEQTHGGPAHDQVFALGLAAPGVGEGAAGWVMAGGTASFGAGGEDMWVVRSDGWGFASCGASSGCFGVKGCDDGNGCTGDFCEGMKGCGHVALADASPCSDGDGCQLPDTCKAGACVAPKQNVFSATYGGADNDYATAIALLADGGTALVGSTASTNLPLGQKSLGGNDFWLVRADAKGKLVWSQTYGGKGPDTATAFTGLADGGLALVGYTESMDLPAGQKSAGDNDYWLVRTDPGGKLLWNQTYGGSKGDFARDVVALADGGLVLAGNTESVDLPGGQKSVGSDDLWLVRTDGSGKLLWSQTYGGSGNDRGTAVTTVPGGGFLVAGHTNSPDLPGSLKTAGGNDFWLVRADAGGTLLSNHTYGGSADEYALSLTRLADGGVALAGFTTSFDLPAGQKTAGDTDMWLVRTDAAGKLLWNQAYGGSLADYAQAMTELGDGGLALAGYTVSFDLPGGQKSAGKQDAWLLRTDAGGKVLWSRTYGGSGSDNAQAVSSLADGGLAFSGRLETAGGADFWLLRTDPWGHASCTESGTCLTKSLADCADASSCTADLCDSKKGCQHIALPDGTPCGGAKTCKAGACP